MSELAPVETEIEPGELRHIIAVGIDYPDVFSCGPRPKSRRQADAVIAMLKHYGLRVVR